MDTYTLIWRFLENPDDTETFQTVKQEVPVTSNIPLPSKDEEITFGDNTYKIMNILRGVLQNKETGMYTTAFRIIAVHAENLKAAAQKKSAEVSRKIRDIY